MTVIKMILVQVLFGMAACCVNTQSVTLHAQPVRKENLLHDKEYKAEWEFYFSTVDDKLGSIAVDLGFHNVAPMQDKQNVAWVSIKLKSPREDGLTTADESVLLGQIEDKVVEKVSSALNAVYVGRLTSDGHRDFYFYISDTSLFGKLVKEAMTGYDQYQYEFGAKPDMGWEGYLGFLYPNPQQFQTILNRRVVDQLEKGGDKLTKAREVSHWIYFKTEADRNSFLQKVRKDGFSLLSSSYDQKLTAFPYKLVITRVDKVDWQSVNEYVIPLWRLASESNGDYDGWETEIIKE
jgi:uncharacterized protein (TIGR01619 family)